MLGLSKADRICVSVKRLVSKLHGTITHSFFLLLLLFFILPNFSLGVVVTTGLFLLTTSAMAMALTSS